MPVFRRRGTLAVAGVSFEVSPVETFAIAGESGSGKTTPARAVNRLHETSNGSVRFYGQRMDRLSSMTMTIHGREMAMMFQDPAGSLSPRMKVGDLGARTLP